MRTLHRPMALLALLLAACSAILFVFPVLTLYDSQWLPGFLIALVGSALGVFFLLPYRGQSILYMVSLYAAPVVLVFHLLLLTPLGSIFGA